jgi:hypothetical protein
MDYQETKKKVVSWCEELQKEGVISKKDLDKCYKSFVSFGSDTTVQKHPKAKTNKKHSFAMLGKQGENTLGEDLTKKKYFQCFLKTKYGFSKTNRSGDKLINKDATTTNINSEKTHRFLSIRKGIEDNKQVKTQLFLASETDKDIILSRFVITLQDNGLYTLMNYGTGNYLKVEADKTITIDTNNITAGAYFNMESKGEFVVFIPRVYPEFKLTPKVNTLILTDGIRAEHNLSIEELPEEEEVELGENQINTVKIRDKIQKIIANMIKNRYEYYGYLAQIDFLKTLQTKIRNMVKSNGDVMNVLYNRREDASTDERKQLTENLLQNISYSIKEELENNELVEIDEEIDNLILTARKFKAQNLTTSDNQINKLISMLNEKIGENKSELESQRQLIGFYNKEQKSMNKQSQIVNDNLKEYTSKTNVNDKNYQIISEKQTILTNEYYYYIAIITLTVIGLGFFGYKLYGRIRGGL